MKKPTRLCYLITSPRGYLVELWEGKALWSPVPHNALTAGNAWLDLQVAKEKLKHCQRALPNVTLSLQLIEFVKEGATWVALCQEGVPADVTGADRVEAGD